MDLNSIFSNKLKAASILLILMAGIIVSNIFEKKMLESSRKAIESIYEDRLQPSTDFFEMRQLIANRMFLLERRATDKTYSKSVFQNDLKEIDKQFKLLMDRYEKTYLVPEEEVFLKMLKEDIHKLNELTSELSNYEEVLIAKRLEELKPKAEAINKDLSELSKMQSKIGQEIVSQYMKDLSVSNVLNSIQVILAIFIGVFVFMMFSNRRITLTKIDKHNLN
ncbi:MCP four helix bundle domain-containing protein [Pseudopedobacter sp.]|uniref:MCP four helix bundle domain-containing protein n=1 Tax=Pseudopedobacter sp. TaxID=1936787 RepID=UPI003342973E